jgi:hypothetical protein
MGPARVSVYLRLVEGQIFLCSLKEKIILCCGPWLLNTSGRVLT